MKPPPLPQSSSASASQPPRKKGRNLILGCLIAAGALLVFILGIAALAGFFLYTAKDFQLTDNQNSCLLDAPAIAEYSDLDYDSTYESLIAQKFIDRSSEVIYIYQNDQDGIYIDNTLSIEPKPSDALIMYNMTKAGAHIGSSLVQDATYETTDRFAWGDTSQYVVSKYKDQEIGFYFIARKRSKIFFITVSGVEFDSQEDINKLLLSRLSAFEKTSF